MLGAIAGNLATWAVLEYRVRQWASASALRPITFPITLLSRLLIQMLTGISLATSAEIGPGLYIGHFGGIVIGEEVRAPATT